MDLILQEFENLKNDLTLYIKELKYTINRQNDIIEEKNSEIDQLKEKIIELEDNYNIILNDLNMYKEKLNHSDILDEIKTEVINEENYCINEIYVVRHEERCPNCDREFTKRSVDVAYYDLKDIDVIKGYMQYEVNLCKTCKQAFMDNRLLKVLIREADPDIIKFNYLYNINNIENEGCLCNELENKDFVKLLNKCLDEDIDSMDEVLIYISNSTNLHKLVQKQFYEIVDIIIKYAQDQLYTGKYSSKAIGCLFKKVYELNWEKLFIKNLREIKENIELLVTENFDIENLILLANIYFVLKYDKYAINIIEKIPYLMQNKKVSLKNQIEILYIAMYYEKDQEIFNSISSNMTEVLKDQVSEISLYYTYYDKLEEHSLTEDSINELNLIKSKCKLIDSKIMDKVFQKLFKNLKDILKSNENISEKIINKEVDNKLDVIESAVRISNNFSKCPKCNNDFSERYCKIVYYKNKHKLLKDGTIKIRSLYCNKCKQDFLNSSLIEELRKSLKTCGINKRRIDIKAYGVTVSKSNNEKGKQKKSQLESVCKSDLCDLSLIGRENKNQNFNIECKINKVSKLGEMGYSVKLSREQRWPILEKGVLKLGLRRVLFHIEWLIKGRKAQKNKDNSHAIFEWEYDLNRLKKKYGIIN